MNFPKTSLPSNERVPPPAKAAPDTPANQEPTRNGGAVNGGQAAVQSDLAPPPPGFQQVPVMDILYRCIDTVTVNYIK
jgi:hypothetical protein